MKVLITGGAGFIGTNYAFWHFQKYPHDEIFVLDKLTYAGNLDNLSALLDEERFHFVEGDIADRDFVYALFDRVRFDLVINFAAESHVDRSISDPDVFAVSNILGTQVLLEASRKYGIGRFHQVSTDEVYGDLPLDSREKFSEESALLPNSPYAASKAAADLMARSYFVTFQLPVTISRCSNNYGPYQFPEKLIPYFISLIREDRAVPVYGDGRHVRDWLYVEDHCEAIDLVIRNGRVGEIYNIGADNELSNLDMTRFLLDFFGRDEGLIAYVDDRPGHDRRYAVNSDKIKTELGWRSKTDFTHGIERTFKWYELNAGWMEKLKDRLVERSHKEISDMPLKPAKG